MVQLTTRSRRARTRRAGAPVRPSRETPAPPASPPEHQAIPNGGAPEPQRPATPAGYPSARVEAGTSIPPEVSGARQLTSDLRTAFLLLNHARYRTLERLFGIGKHEANLVTAVIALVAAEKAGRAMEGLAVPRPSDFALGLGAGRSLIEDVAGPAAQDTPLLASLVTLAILGGGARPAVIWSTRAVKSASHHVRAAFNLRYHHPIQRPSGRG